MSYTAGCCISLIMKNECVCGSIFAFTVFNSSLIGDSSFFYHHPLNKQDGKLPSRMVSNPFLAVVASEGNSQAFEEYYGLGLERLTN